MLSLLLVFFFILDYVRHEVRGWLPLRKTLPERKMKPRGKTEKKKGKYTRSPLCRRYGFTHSLPLFFFIVTSLFYFPICTLAYFFYTILFSTPVRDGFFSFIGFNILTL